MARNRGGNLSTRVAGLERRSDWVRGRGHPQVTIYLPRKDSDARPLGTVSDAGGVRFVLYVVQRPTPS